MSRVHRHSPGLNEVIVGDALEQLTRLPEHYVDLVVTSPPYFRLRDYDVAGQIGMEASIDQWVHHLRLVARQLARVLTPTGSFWLNLGDSYSTHPREGAARKSLLLGPERLLLALQTDGWTVRNKVIWAKTNPIPSPARDRLATTYEAVFFLTRSPRYFFDLDAIRIPSTTVAPRPTDLTSRAGREAWRGPSSLGRGGLNDLARRGANVHPLGKNPGDVWRFATARGVRGHHAAFPLALADRIVLAGSPEAVCSECSAPFQPSDSPACTCGAPDRPGRVLDPFLGSGTTAVAAEAHSRDWLGIELNPAYARTASERVQAARRTRGRAPPPAPSDGQPSTSNREEESR